MRTRVGLAFFLSALASACTTNPPPTEVDGGGGAVDAGVDAPDAYARADTGPRPDAWTSPDFDTSTTWHAPPLDCPSGPAHRGPRDLGTQRRFALSVLHYNIQYVAGGLAGATIGGREPFPDWGDDRVQDAIVTESLVPVLELLDRHPSWTLSIEMQGYMVEVLLARHRAVAQHLSDLVRSGQVELVSFHYSDQLFLAYPRSHMEHSRALNAEVLADACLEASGPVFTQEGQFGEGMADLLGAGNDAVVMLPKNLFSHEHGEQAPEPYYLSHGVPVVVSGRGATEPTLGFESVWIYMDDAELLPTGRNNPYVGPSFVVHPDAVAAFETQLETLESQGYVIAGVGDWVATLDGAGYTAPPLPPMLDGTWQPDDTENLARWMGNTGGFAATERDNAVVSGSSEAGREVLAAEIATRAAADAGHPVAGADEEIARAWRDLLIGEVSDSTGWNPLGTEVYYGQFHAELARTRARAAAVAAASALGISPPFVVDTAAGTVTAGTASLALEDDPSPPFAISAAPHRPYTTRWQRVVGESDHHVLTVTFAPGDSYPAIVFDWPLDHVRYTPALLDGTLVDYALSDFAIVSTGISIDDGPFGLDTDRWLILDTATIALAARLDPIAHRVAFEDHSVPEAEGASWTFHVVTGTSARALAVADRVSLHPLVAFDVP